MTRSAVGSIDSSMVEVNPLKSVCILVAIDAVAGKMVSRWRVTTGAIGRIDNAMVKIDEQPIRW